MLIENIFMELCLAGVKVMLFLLFLLRYVGGRCGKCVSCCIFYFSHHFKARSNTRPGMDDLHFCALSYRERYELINTFCIEEVKVVVWDCDSYKSLGRMVLILVLSMNFGMC